MKAVAGLLVVILLLLVASDPEWCPDGCTNQSAMGTSAVGGTSPDAPDACFLCASGVEPTLVDAASFPPVMLRRDSVATVPFPPSIAAQPLDHPPKRA